MPLHLRLHNHGLQRRRLLPGPSRHPMLHQEDLLRQQRERDLPEHIGQMLRLFCGRPLSRRLQHPGSSTPPFVLHRLPFLTHNHPHPPCAHWIPILPTTTTVLHHLLLQQPCRPRTTPTLPANQLLRLLHRVRSRQRRGPPLHLGWRGVLGPLVRGLRLLRPNAVRSLPSRPRHHPPHRRDAVRLEHGPPSPPRRSPGWGSAVLGGGRGGLWGRGRSGACRDLYGRREDGECGA